MAIQVAAALIDNGAGRILLVRKAETTSFMLPGGKIEQSETALDALARELEEEIGLLPPVAAVPLGRFEAEAANEPGHTVAAALFHITRPFTPRPAAEIAEARWVDMRQAERLPLAPLVRTHVLPLFDRLGLTS
ncbi:hypothetical protein A7X12_07790 [Sphingomonas sp. TDK1]|nr:hypothetical protein A7X12_07790 [Sphingomonas sp. TDK1]